MRYTIEATENSCTEIFELRNGKKYIRKHSRTQYGSICNDAMFDDQLEADGVDPDIIEGANDLFGGSMPLEFMNMASGGSEHRRKLNVKEKDVTPDTDGYKTEYEPKGARHNDGRFF